MMFASINDVDISDKIQDSTYKVDSEDIVDTWVDASEKNHERIYRSRVKGSFELAFVSDGTGVGHFWDLIEGASKGRVLKIKVFINNLCMTKEIECHFKLEGIKRVDLKNGYFYDRLKMTLEEV